jgi:HK97 gp10 family phage protein
MAEFVKIGGLEQTVAALRALPKEISGNNGGPMRGALFAASKVIRDEVDLLAPEDTGNLKRNIMIVRDRNPGIKGANERYMVSVRTGQRSKRAKKAYAAGKINQRLRVLGGGDAYYFIYKEFGTKKMSAKPFMRPAFERTKGEALVKFIVEMRKGVSAAVMRARRKGGVK